MQSALRTADLAASRCAKRRTKVAEPRRNGAKIRETSWQSLRCAMLHALTRCRMRRSRHSCSIASLDRSMVDLFCTPVCRSDPAHAAGVSRIRQAIFDLPARRWWLPAADGGAPDLSVRFHDRVAGNAVGPASGPQTQMAQNLVLSWLAGARIMELKTVQVNDELKISPAVHRRGQRRLQHRVVAGAAGRRFARSVRARGDADPHAAARAGACSASRLATWIRWPARAARRSTTCRSATTWPASDRRRSSTSSRHDRRDAEASSGCATRFRSGSRPLRDLDYPTQLSRSITLSTFHGCPADEIERICEFLLTELGVHTIVKMNPPMLGKERLEHLLYDVMGYTELRVNPTAYTIGPAVRRVARHVRPADGAGHVARPVNSARSSPTRSKWRTTATSFQPSEKIMYLSGPPLHVITLTLADEFRQAVGPELPISFSAGVDRKNFAEHRRLRHRAGHDVHRPA